MTATITFRLRLYSLAEVALWHLLQQVPGIDCEEKSPEAGVFDGFGYAVVYSPAPVFIGSGVYDIIL